MAMYNFPSSLRASSSMFTKTVLELVKLVQTAIALFDMFPSSPEEQNGLLCDVTVDGLQRWVREVGESYMKIEPMERIADPPTLAALLSLILCVRNKLNAIGISHTVPKDPFLHPRRFTRALATFVNQRLLHLQSPSSGHFVHTHGISHSLSHFSAAPLLPSAQPSSSQTQSQSPTNAGPTPINHAFLNLALIGRIDAAFEKVRSSEAYKVHRALLSKLDDLTSATTSAIASSSATIGLGINVPGSGSSAPAVAGSGKEKDRTDVGLEGTADLGALVAKCTLLRGKEGAPSVRYLWTGKLDVLERKRTEALGEGGAWVAQDEREVARKMKDGERSEEEEEEEIEGLGVLPWSNRVQRKIESWAG